jgi:hypothetical protein
MKEIGCRFMAEYAETEELADGIVESMTREEEKHVHGEAEAETADKENQDIDDVVDDEEEEGEQR